MGGTRGLVIAVGAAALLSGPSAHASSPRCHIVPGPPARTAPDTQASPQPSSPIADPQSVTVVIPRVICRPTPKPTPIRGNGGGNGSGNGIQAGGGGSGQGGIPFTGFDLETYLALGAALLGAGGLLARSRRPLRRH